MIILYTPQCLICHHKDQMKRLKAFVHTYGLKLEERRTSRSKDYQMQSNSLQMKEPFLYNPDTGRKVDFYGDFTELL